MPITSKGLRYPGSTDSPNVPLDLQKLAQDTDTALPGAWVTITQSAANYNAAPATTWTTLTDFAGATVTVPAGRTLDVEFKAPRCQVGVNSQVSCRLKIGASSYPDSSDVIFSGTGVQGAAGMILTASVVGTGVGVSVSVEAIRAGDGFVQGNTVVGPRLRYRIV